MATNYNKALKARSPVWGYFSLCDDDSTKVICKVCSDRIPRGGSNPKSFNTTNLRKHLEKRHLEKYRELLKVEKEKARVNSSDERQASQPKIDESFEAMKPYNTESPRYIAITNAVARMIATDFQPFSIVEDEGFKLVLNVMDQRYKVPSRKYFSEKIIPNMYKDVREKVKSSIQSATFLAMTTDCWTSRAVDSYLSITAHFIDDKFKRRLAVLDTFPMCERHTAQNLLSKILSILETWEIDKKKISCFVRDNAANITAAIRDGGFANIGCVDHTLQLAINDSLKVDAVADLIKTVKTVVGHFHRSSASRQLLSNIQVQLQVPEHQLSQECSTRWNSTFYMLERFHEQRRAITTVLPETTCTAELTISQWTLVGQLVTLLRPFEEFSREFERADASISLIIPGVRLLLKHVSKPVVDEENPVIKIVRKELESALNTRFLGVETCGLHGMATLLDPRFKIKGFSAASFAEMAKSKVIEDAKKIAAANNNPSTAPSSSNEESEEITVRCKKRKKESSLWEDFDKDDSDSPVVTTEAERELEQYLSISRLLHSDNPLQFWVSHGVHFPNLAPLTKKLLAIPPTSAESERVFSCAGNVVVPTRTCLDPDKVKMLVFLNRNREYM